MVFRLVTLVMTACFAAGCYECNLDNCKDGCCSAQGICIVAPTSDKECGLGGLLCQDCTEKVGFTCQQSQCKSRCSALSCDGCCTPTATCVSHRSMNTLSCGPRGEACVSCGTNRTCQVTASTMSGKCCGQPGYACSVSYDCCTGLTCRPAGNGGLTCQ